MDKKVYFVFLISVFTAAVLAGGGDLDCSAINANFKNLSQEIQTQFYDLIVLSSHRPESEIILAVKEETLDIMNTYPDLSENDIHALSFIDLKGESGAICVIKLVNTPV